MVNDEQLTLTWHVDDVKVSHVETQVVDDFIVYPVLTNPFDVWMDSIGLISWK